MSENAIGDTNPPYVTARSPNGNLVVMLRPMPVEERAPKGSARRSLSTVGERAGIGKFMYTPMSAHIPGAPKYMRSKFLTTPSAKMRFPNGAVVMSENSTSKLISNGIRSSMKLGSAIVGGRPIPKSSMTERMHIDMSMRICGRRTILKFMLTFIPILGRPITERAVSSCGAISQRTESCNPIKFCPQIGSTFSGAKRSGGQLFSLVNII
mmetsp:Transcript_48696/g.127252  ORF Transcript_48696/g.127252 Transcript_48696/m.127252 type:complete len:210 (-) Transcript_48696:1611-2240(-)